MNSRSRKTGGAYRYAKQRSSLHTKKGKDRGKSRGQYNTQAVTCNSQKKIKTEEDICL
ncbi:MAG: hypothetical protein IKB62_04235 [Oscillospiraceae bacterium]|nr:hypothetical protein [Oscillospiraceae bacterium]